MRRYIFKVLGVLIGLIFIYVNIDSRRQFDRLQATGKTAIVEPIQRYKSRKGTYSAEFTFVTEDGQKITRLSSFPKELLSDLKDNKPVKVRYDPVNPREFVFEQDTKPWFVGVVGMVVVVLAMLFL